MYEDADIACELLEKHQFTRAHFHWFKGSRQTIRRMADNGYYVSFTPDILYETEIRELARQYPAEQVMAETDGPWPFEGPFHGQMTHPAMTREVIQAWSEITGMGIERAARLFTGIPSVLSPARVKIAIQNIPEQDRLHEKASRIVIGQHSTSHTSVYPTDFGAAVPFCPTGF